MLDRIDVVVLNGDVVVGALGNDFVRQRVGRSMIADQECKRSVLCSLLLTFRSVAPLHRQVTIVADAHPSRTLRCARSNVCIADALASHAVVIKRALGESPSPSFSLILSLHGRALSLSFRVDCTHRLALVVAHVFIGASIVARASFARIDWRALTGCVIGTRRCVCRFAHVFSFSAGFMFLVRVHCFAF